MTKDGYIDVAAVLSARERPAHLTHPYQSIQRSEMLLFFILMK
jgi:hypothetical protein